MNHKPLIVNACPGKEYQKSNFGTEGMCENAKTDEDFVNADESGMRDRIWNLNYEGEIYEERDDGTQNKN